MKRIALRLLLAVSLLLPGAVVGAPTALAQEPPATGGSPAKKSGTGEFAGLEVTVSATKDLINQSVLVSWTGGKQTVESGGYRADFMQVMQCWGDDPTGPDRTQCQFGALGGDAPSSGAGVRLRTISATPNDPLETLDDDPNTPVIEPVSTGGFVPFWAAGKERPAPKDILGRNDFFDGQITNEVPLARTRGDGTGELEFEVQTVREAAGLGCGEPVDVGGVTKGRSCWLVIVPRGEIEVDGTKVVDDAGRSNVGLQTSPLSQTNWKNKIAIPMEFRPVGRACPLGAPERRLTGHELVVDAVSSWQPKLCEGGGALYGFTQLSDDLSRTQLIEATDPGLTLMSRPVPPDQIPSDRPIVYAPVAVSALTFAFGIVKQPQGIEPDDPKQALVGVPFTEMKLTPRLVAKLLTQSYRGAIAGLGFPVPSGPGERPGRLETNPFGLTVDPEFLELNPEYKDLQFPRFHVDALVQLGTSDLIALLWDWVLADPDARAFIEGTSASGTVVNPFNKGLQPPLDTYPRNDQTCVPPAAGSPDNQPPDCTGDAHQFANDMHEAGRAASRGDTLGRVLQANPQPGQPPESKRIPRQPITQRGLIAIVDAATAERYGLSMAKLLNAAKQFVAPDEAGLRAGLAAMKPSAVLGVLQPDPTTLNADAYPLTALSYAATSPAALTEAAGREYATFLRYAAGNGQQPGLLPGQLPFGYVPLTDPMRAQTLAAATTIETQAGKAAGADPPGDIQNGGAAGGGSGAGAGAGIRPDTVADPAATPFAGAEGAAVPGAIAPAAPSPGAAAQPVADVRRTPALPAPAVGALLVALLVCGGVSAALSPLTHHYGVTRRNDTGKGGDATDRTAARSRLSWLTARPALLARRR